MKKTSRVLRTNMNLARSTWGPLSRFARQGLLELLEKHSFSVVLGDIQYLDRHWYITHSGLLRLASHHQCKGIRVSPVRGLCEPASGRWVFKATVYTSSNSRGFVGYGDADPPNVFSGPRRRDAGCRNPGRQSRFAQGLWNRAVLGRGTRLARHPQSRLRARGKRIGQSNGNGSANGQPRLRDKLCLLIRKYELDPNLVKRYAADFCGTESLRDAGRDLVEAFVSTVAEEAAKRSCRTRLQVE